MRIGFIFVVLLFNTFCGLCGGGGYPMPETTTPPSLDFTPLLAAEQQNEVHLTNIVKGIQQVVAGQLVAVSNLARATAFEAAKINKRTISEKTRIVNTTVADSNSKSNSVQSSLNNMNENIDSILKVSPLIGSETGQIKGTTDEIKRKLYSIGIMSNNIPERIASVRQTTDVIQIDTDSIRTLIFDTHDKVDLVQELVDGLIAIANLIDQKFDLRR